MRKCRKSCKSVEGFNPALKPGKWLLPIGLVIGGVLIAGCFGSRRVQVRQPDSNSPTNTETTNTTTVAAAPTLSDTKSPTATITQPFLPIDTDESVMPSVAAATPSQSVAINNITLLSCKQDGCIYSAYQVLQRPIPLAFNRRVERTYRYGSTQEGSREVHHGVEFENPGGTPVLAASNGTVIIAGDDSKTSFGPVKGFYGNLVILEHKITGLDQPIFTIYGHLSTINVTVGDAVKKGQQIGRVGKTGTAAGSHLHFEVRLGENSYSATVNPELWLEPLLSETTNLKLGALIIQLSRDDGDISSVLILIQNFDDPKASVHKFIDAESYALHTPVDAFWKENLAVGDLEPGIYRISFTRSGKMYQKFFEIEPASITLVEFQIDN